jgi:hypothetical protein
MGGVGIVAFLVYKGKKLTEADIVPGLTIFASSMGFVYSGCQICYIVLSNLVTPNQSLGALQTHWGSLLLGGIAVMWLSVLAVVKCFKK